MTTQTNHPSNNTSTADVPSAPPETHRRANSSSQHEVALQDAVALQLAMASVRPFLSRAQFSLMEQGCKGEEAGYFRDVLLRLSGLIRSMPKTWDQENLGERAVVSLHYFLGGSDWYILEKDIDGGIDQAFGYVVLNGDELCAECGYISIREVTSLGAELNLHFQPKTLEVVKLERQQEGVA